MPVIVLSLVFFLPLTLPKGPIQTTNSQGKPTMSGITLFGINVSPERIKFSWGAVKTTTNERKKRGSTYSHIYLTGIYLTKGRGKIKVMRMKLNKPFPFCV